MTKFDKDYLELCKKILNEGYEVRNRTGINTIKVPSHNFEFDLEKEFPILQSKQTFYKNAIIEMLWIWQMQSNDVRLLHDRGVHIWDEWMVDKDGIYRIYDNNNDYFDANRKVVVMDALSGSVTDPGNLTFRYDNKGRVMKAKSLIPGKNIIGAKYYGKEYAYTIGTAYGYIVNRYKHTQNLINTLKKNKEDRRMVKSLWQDEFLNTAVLPSCVWSTEWDVTSDKLNLSVHQRSCDVPLGLPFNVTQYATLLSMVAHVTDLIPGKINYSIKDAHIYVNQIDGVNEQINRWNYYNEINSLASSYLRDRFDYLELMLTNPYSIYSEEEKNKLIFERNTIDMIINGCKPELWLNPRIRDFFSFDNSRELKDIKIKKYKHMGKIEFPISQ
ncbi:MAG: thymidylate synthase [Bacilli bacterium]|nr:thymidylate synthase [Bacilli bacterium]